MNKPIVAMSIGAFALALGLAAGASDAEYKAEKAECKAKVGEEEREGCYKDAKRAHKKAEEKAERIAKAEKKLERANHEQAEAEQKVIKESDRKTGEGRRGSRSRTSSPPDLRLLAGLDPRDSWVVTRYLTTPSLTSNRRADRPREG